MGWREAFAQQAKSDYEMYLFLNEKKKPICHQLHYLQMASEKLAKAWLCPDNGKERPPQTHRTLSRFLIQAKSTPQIRAACKMSHRRAQFRASIDGLNSIAQKIESLAPVGDVDKPNPEYPWYSNDNVVCPLDHPFRDIICNQQKILKFRRFLEICFKIV